MPGGIATPVDTVSRNNPTGSNTNAGGNNEGHFLNFCHLSVWFQLDSFIIYRKDIYALHHF